MNIWLPIITNIVIALILLTGIFVGSKNGWKLGLSKLILVICDGVGCYFLQPIVTDLIKLDIEHSILGSVVYLSLFILIYAIISIIVAVVRNATHTKTIDGINSAKRTKIKGLDKKTTRELRREERKYRKLHKEVRELKKASKSLGGFFGFITALIIGFIIMLPMKNVSKTIAETQPKLEEITKGYEYTIYGQLDKISNLSDIIIKD